MKILGVSGVFGHDASACLVVANTVVAFVEEERFSRVRYAPDALPAAADGHCLAQGGLRWDDLDAIALGWDSARAPDMSWLSHYTSRIARGPWALDHRSILARADGGEAWRLIAVFQNGTRPSGGRLSSSK